MNSGGLKGGKIAVCVLGILFGIYCVIAGFTEQFFKFDLNYDPSSNYLADNTYGADFYTEMSKTSADIMYNTSDIVRLVKNGIHSILIIAGVLMICGFLLQLLKAVGDGAQPAPAAPRPYDPPLDTTPINGDFSGGSILGEPESASGARANAMNGSWTCWKCGANNPEYLTACSCCGLTKHESDVKAGAEEQLRVLKERHDKGLISDEEYASRRGELAAKL